MTQGKTLRAMLREMLQQLDPEMLGYTIRVTGFYLLVACLAVLVFLWQLALLWKGCV